MLPLPLDVPPTPPPAFSRSQSLRSLEGSPPPFGKHGSHWRVGLNDGQKCSEFQDISSTKFSNEGGLTYVMGFLNRRINMEFNWSVSEGCCGEYDTERSGSPSATHQRYAACSGIWQFGGRLRGRATRSLVGRGRAH